MQGSVLDSLGEGLIAITMVLRVMAMQTTVSQRALKVIESNECIVGLTYAAVYMYIFRLMAVHPVFLYPPLPLPPLLIPAPLPTPSSVL